MDTARARHLWNGVILDAPVQAAILACMVAVVCYQSDRLVYVLGIPPDHIASFWPPTAFLVAVLLLVRQSIQPVLIVAGLGAMALADLRNGVPIGFEIWVSLGNLGELLVAVWGIGRLFKGVPDLSSVTAFLKYFVFAVILVPFASALVGANASAPGGYWLQWQLWFFADALAFLTVAPAILNWVREGRVWARESRNKIEFAALMASLFFFWISRVHGHWATGTSIGLFPSAASTMGRFTCGIEGCVHFDARCCASIDLGGFSWPGPVRSPGASQ